MHAIGSAGGWTGRGSAEAGLGEVDDEQRGEKSVPKHLDTSVGRETSVWKRLSASLFSRASDVSAALTDAEFAAGILLFCVRVFFCCFNLFSLHLPPPKCVQMCFENKSTGACIDVCILSSSLSSLECW